MFGLSVWAATLKFLSLQPSGIPCDVGESLYTTVVYPASNISDPAGVTGLDSLPSGQKCPIICTDSGDRLTIKIFKAMRGSELIKRVETLGKDRGVAVRVDKKRGKGSHQILYFGERKTTIRNPKDELKTGTYHAMLKQLGITEKDLK